MALYCSILPFCLVDDMGWVAVPIIFLICFTLYGIEGYVICLYIYISREKKKSMAVSTLIPILGSERSWKIHSVLIRTISRWMQSYQTVRRRSWFSLTVGRGMERSIGSSSCMDDGQIVGMRSVWQDAELPTAWAEFFPHLSQID